MFRSASQAYESVTKHAASGRELEAAALFKAARLLDGCRQNWAAADRRQRLEEALRFNQRLWTLFQTDLSRPGHALPVDVRVNLLRISAFMDKRTFEILAEPSPEKLQALIDIDRNIALGLSGSEG